MSMTVKDLGVDDRFTYNGERYRVLPANEMVKQGKQVLRVLNLDKGINEYFGHPDTVVFDVVRPGDPLETKSQMPLFNYTTIADWRDSEVTAHINKFAEKGYELISITPVSNSKAAIVMMKY